MTGTRMPRSLAAVVYFTLYSVIALLPLHMAMVADPHPQSRGLGLEFAVGLGFVAWTLLLLELVLVSRLRTLSDAFGTDALLQFHRALGLAASVFLLGHVIGTGALGGLWQWFDPFAGSLPARSGAIAFWALAVLVVTSLLRRALRLGYDAWNRIHRIGTLVLLAGSATHILSVSGYTAAPSVRNLVLLLALSFFALLLNYQVLRPLRLWRRPWRVTANPDIGGDTHLLNVRPEGHAGFRFEPGQFAWLITGRSPFTHQQHPITIASSAESAGTQQYAIKKLGDWSRETVPALAPGDRLWVEGPYGALSVDRLPAQGFVLIAGGIGITPMRSILLTLRDRGDRRSCLLFYAANDFSRVVFREEFSALCRQIDLKVVYVLEHPDGGDDCERGRIDRALLERHLPTARRHFQYLVCGPNPMMDSIERLLFDLGIDDERIHSERFNQI